MAAVSDGRAMAVVAGESAGWWPGGFGLRHALADTPTDRPTDKPFSLAMLKLDSLQSCLPETADPARLVQDALTIPFPAAYRHWCSQGASRAGVALSSVGHRPCCPPPRP